MSVVTILQGDALARLRDMPDESVHCCVTSPPYWRLRDYGTGEWEGGNPKCDHRGRSLTSEASTLDYWKQGGGKERLKRAGGVPFSKSCGKCGAVWTDLQLGLEDTPEEYVDRVVEIFREVRRVLRSDGTLWLNLGDSYSGGGCGSRNPGQWPIQSRNDNMPVHSKRKTGLANKQLLGIPWRCAFALQADGWWLRQEIIWAKPNPMPESVTDRCSKSHEQVFLLSKRPTYYFDHEAIKEPASESYINDGRWDTGPTDRNEKHGYEEAGARNPKKPHAVFNGEKKLYANKRSVWTVTLRRYREAHFATYPPELVKPCILAGCPIGGTVLDPFGGAGTTGLVAMELGRRAILIELKPDYADMADRRCRTTAGLQIGGFGG